MPKMMAASLPSASMEVAEENGAREMFEPVRAGSGGLSRHEQVIEAEVVGQPVLPRPVERALVTAVAKQYARGVVGKVRVETTYEVARHALRALSDLEADEIAAIAPDPVNAGRRHRRIVDTAAYLFDDAVYRTGRGS
jgi:hypothetical protein